MDIRVFDHVFEELVFDFYHVPPTKSPTFATCVEQMFETWPRADYIRITNPDWPGRGGPSTPMNGRTTTVNERSTASVGEVQL
jgi:hypothetical protein